MWFELWQHSILSLLDLGFLEQALVNQEKGSETTKEHSINVLVKCEAKACKSESKVKRWPWKKCLTLCLTLNQMHDWNFF